MSPGWLLWWELISEHFSFMLRIRRNDLYKAKALVPSTELAVSKDRLSHLSPWATCHTANQWHNKVLGGGGWSLPRHNVTSLSQREKEKLLQMTLSGKACPSPKASGNFLHRIYCKKLKPFCLPPNWVCWGKNNPFSPYYTLWNPLGPVGQAIPEALSGLGPFCDIERCTVLCQWSYCTDRRHSSCYSSRQVGEGSGFWVKEQGSKTKHSSRDGVTAQR